CVSQIYSAIYSGDIKNIGSSTAQCAPVLPTIIIHTDSETKQALRDVIPASLLSANEVILESDL
ncbi:MAG: hypothetical protein O7D30_10940, partial [Rickettsia endosymbiont of Ixodes persulcatus]|nr:hypothetical protein [Rickettsia endosymbiont of Ixodes persulcatus]